LGGFVQLPISMGLPVKKIEMRDLHTSRPSKGTCYNFQNAM
jgi:hypothetical protein